METQGMDAKDTTAATEPMGQDERPLVSLKEAVTSPGVTGFAMPGAKITPAPGIITTPLGGRVCPPGMYQMMCFGRLQCIPLGSIC
jgi:hypothetical protein